jgi:CO/xanthine dehydrogenase Mo-binding subunit
VLGIEASQLRVTPSEIGGGFGGKTTIFMEPLALALSRKAGGRPVKLVMSRSEVLRATGPTASASMDVKLGMKKDGTITAGKVFFRMQGGPFIGSSPVGEALSCAFACYDIPASCMKAMRCWPTGPRPPPIARPGSPMAAFAVESLLDEMCRELGLDPFAVRLKNAAREGTKSSYGPTYNRIGLAERLRPRRPIRT